MLQSGCRLSSRLSAQPGSCSLAPAADPRAAAAALRRRCFRNPVTRDTPALLGGDEDDGEQRGHEAMEEDEEQVGGVGGWVGGCACTCTCARVGARACGLCARVHACIVWGRGSVCDCCSCCHGLLQLTAPATGPRPAALSHCLLLTPPAPPPPSPPSLQDPARVAAAILLQDDLNNVLLTLTDREAGIVRMRFGLDDGVEKTLEEVGRAFNVGGPSWR